MFHPIHEIFREILVAVGQSVVPEKCGRCPRLLFIEGLACGREPKAAIKEVPELMERRAGVGDVDPLGPVVCRPNTIHLIPLTQVGQIVQVYRNVC